MADEASARWARRGLFAALSLLLIGRVWLFEVASVDNDGMSPALLPGEVVWVWRGPAADIAPGAVVLYADSGVRDIKRVVAVAGQEVELSAGALYVDGGAARTGHEGRVRFSVEVGCQEIEAEGVVEVFDDRSVLVRPAGNIPAERIPEDHLYILGDHRAESSDSRQWGPLPASSVEGTVGRVLWSRSPCGGTRWSRIGSRVR